MKEDGLAFPKVTDGLPLPEGVSKDRFDEIMVIAIMTSPVDSSDDEFRETLRALIDAEREKGGEKTPILETRKKQGDPGYDGDADSDAESAKKVEVQLEKAVEKAPEEKAPEKLPEKKEPLLPPLPRPKFTKFGAKEVERIESDPVAADMYVRAGRKEGRKEGRSSRAGRKEERSSRARRKCCCSFPFLAARGLSGGGPPNSPCGRRG